MSGSGVCALAPSELTASTASVVRADVLALAAPGCEVPLALSAVQRFDRCGLALLLDLHRAARVKGARVVCVDPAPRLMVAMRRLGMDRILALQTDS